MAVFLHRPTPADSLFSVTLFKCAKSIFGLVEGPSEGLATLSMSRCSADALADHHCDSTVYLECRELIR